MTIEELTEYIKDAIIREKLLPRQRLVEIEICEKFNVGRNRVREALRHLAQEGYIEIIKYRGAIVRELTQKDIAQNNDIVGVLEGLAARIAVPTIKDGDILKIEKIIDDVKDNKDNYLKVFEYNDKFHRLLMSLSENDKLINLLEMLYGHIRRSSLQGFYNQEQIQATISEHDAILDAIKERNPTKVENLIRKHYISSKNRLLRTMNRTL